MEKEMRKYYNWYKEIKEKKKLTQEQIERAKDKLFQLRKDTNVFLEKYRLIRKDLEHENYMKEIRKGLRGACHFH